MKAIRYFFPFVLLLVTVNASAQASSICGKIRSGTLTIPSYKFVVVDKNGRAFEHLNAVGFIEMDGNIWGHSYGDWNWETERRFLPVPITFDRKEAIYVLKTMTKVTIKNAGQVREPCPDRLRRFYVGFTLGNEFTETAGYAGGYGVNLWDKTLEEITLPDPRDSIKITLKSWGGIKEP